MIRWLKVATFLVCLVPLAIEVWLAFHDGLGANPLEHITHMTGDWTIRFIVITLSVSPFRKLLNWPSLIRFRRMLGLFAFFYAVLHFLTYFVLDRFFSIDSSDGIFALTTVRHMVAAVADDVIHRAADGAQQAGSPAPLAELALIIGDQRGLDVAPPIKDAVDQRL